MAYVPGKGTAIKISISGTFTVVPQTPSITGPQEEMGQIETTHLASTAHEYMSDAMPESGEIQFTIEWDPANSVHTLLRTNFLAGTTFAWELVYADAGPTTDAFSAFITKLPISEAQINEKQTIAVTAKVTGLVTRTTGS